MKAFPITGWAVRTICGIDTFTVSATRRAAIVNWLVAGEHNQRRVMIFAHHDDALIERRWASRSRNLLAEVIQVTITEKTDG